MERRCGAELLDQFAAYGTIASEETDSEIQDPVHRLRWPWCDGVRQIKQQRCSPGWLNFLLTDAKRASVTGQYTSQTFKQCRLAGAVRSDQA